MNNRSTIGIQFTCFLIVLVLTSPIIKLRNSRHWKHENTRFPLQRAKKQSLLVPKECFTFLSFQPYVFYFKQKSMLAFAKCCLLNRSLLQDVQPEVNVEVQCHLHIDLFFFHFFPFYQKCH